MNTGELKRDLITTIMNTSNLIMQKSKRQYPQVAERYKEAARKLNKLWVYIDDKIPFNHELFMLENKINEKNNYNLTQHFMPIRRNAIEMYGFQDQTDPEKWIEEQILVMKELIKLY